VPDVNARNLLYFEAPSMRELFESMDAWQASSGKRLLSAAVHQDREQYCCIALSNPMEVVICSGLGSEKAYVDGDNRLWVYTRGGD
jgi:hypothetical protein